MMKDFKILADLSSIRATEDCDDGYFSVFSKWLSAL